MTHLSFSVRFHQPYFHGRDEKGDPEWPPSPLRLFQAMIAAASGRWNERRRIEACADPLRWLEQRDPPMIIAPVGSLASSGYFLYVPDNVGDIAATEWSRDKAAKVRRVEKYVQPIHLAGDRLDYAYSLPGDDCPQFGDLREAARSMTHMGAGIDLVIGDADIRDDLNKGGVAWTPSSSGSIRLRIPRKGTFDELSSRHEAFLRRIEGGVFRPVPPLTAYRDIVYKSDPR